MSEVEWIAAVGSALLLLAFFLNQRGFIAANSVAYLLLNLCGASIAAVAAWKGDILPFVVLEGVWGTVAALGLIALYRRAPAAGAK